MMTVAQVHSGVHKFVQTCIEVDPTAAEKISFLWHRWVHFAQTHPDVKAYWPDDLPRTPQALSKALKIIYPGIGKERRAASIKQDGINAKRGGLVVMFRGLKFKRDATWENFDGEWYPLPWSQGPTNLGTPLPDIDPSHYKYEARKLRAVGAAAKLNQLRKECGVRTDDWGYNYFLKKCDNILKDPNVNVITNLYPTDHMVNEVRKIIFSGKPAEPPNMIAHRVIIKVLEIVAAQTGDDPVYQVDRDRHSAKEDFDLWARPLAESGKLTINEGWDMFWRYKDQVRPGTPEYDTLMRGILKGRPVIAVEPDAEFDAEFDDPADDSPADGGPADYPAHYPAVDPDDLLA